MVEECKLNKLNKPNKPNQFKKIDIELTDGFSNVVDVFSELGLEVETNVANVASTDASSLMFEVDKSKDIALFKSSDLKKALDSLVNLTKVSGKDVFFKSVWFSREHEFNSYHLYASDGISSGRRLVPFHEIYNSVNDFSLDFKQIHSIMPLMGYIVGLLKTDNGMSLLYSGGESSMFSLNKYDILETFTGYKLADSCTVKELLEAFKFARYIALKAFTPDLSKIFISDNTVWSFDGKSFSSFLVPTSFNRKYSFLLKDIEKFLKFFESASDVNVNLYTKDSKVMFSVVGYGDLVIQTHGSAPDISLYDIKDKPQVLSFNCGITQLLYNLMIALRTREIGVVSVDISDSGFRMDVRDLKGGRCTCSVPLSEFRGNSANLSIDLDRFIRTIAHLSVGKVESIATFKLVDNLFVISFENKTVIVPVVFPKGKG